MADKNSVFVNNSAPSVDDTWLNMTQDERDNIITAGGLTPTPATNDQVVDAITNIVANADYYTDGGAADAYVLSVISPNVAPDRFRVGMRIRFRTSNVNTGASTINVASLGVKNIKLEDGSTDPSAGDISDSVENTIVYDGTVFRLTTIVDASTTVKGRVELLTDAELATGTDTTRAATAASILSLFNTSSRSFSGYFRIPINVGGTFVEMIIQWGNIAVNGDITGGVKATSGAFPLTFPTAVLFATTGVSDETGGSGNNIVTGWDKGSTTTSTLHARYQEATSVSQSGNWNISYLAIGY